MEEKRNRVFERKHTESMMGTTEQETSTASTKMPERPKNALKIEVHATATHHHKQLDPVVAHAQAHDFSHSQSVSRPGWDWDAACMQHGARSIYKHLPDF